MKQNPSSKIQEGLIGEIKSRRERLNGAVYDHDTEKTRATIVRRQQNELLLAKARDEVILKPLVDAQATFVAVTLRQMILAFPLKAARKMVGLPDEKAAKRILDKIAHDLCKELVSFPAEDNRSWLARENLEGEGLKSPPGRLRSAASEQLLGEPKHTGRSKLSLMRDNLVDRHERMNFRLPQRGTPDRHGHASGSRRARRSPGQVTGGIAQASSAGSGCILCELITARTSASGLPETRASSAKVDPFFRALIIWKASIT